MKIPLAKKRTDFSFKSGVSDYPAIRKAANPNPFGIKPDPPPLQLQHCNASKECTYVYDPNSKIGSGSCKGYCATD